MRSHPLLIALSAAAVMAGCGGSSGSTRAPVNPNAKEVSPAGDIPDNQAYVPYTVPGRVLTVKVPEGWSQRSAGGAVTFTDKLNAITIKTVRAAKAPTEGSVRPPSGGRVTTVHRSAGPAIRITYLARSQPDPVTGKTRTDAVERYLFFHKGTELVLTLSGPKGADNVDPWKLVTDSVAWR